MERPTAMAPATIVAISLLLSICVFGCTQAPGTGGIPFNLPPTPVITTDKERGVAPLPVQFRSDRSTDDGLIVARLWDFGDGATSQEISPRHTFTTNGDFTVSLTLTDDLGAEATSTQLISVTQAPVPVIAVDPAVAGPAPAMLTFDGSASFDPDGEIVEHRWDFDDGSREFLQVVTHVYASPGTYRATLTVTDDKGVTGTSEKLIEVDIPTPRIEIRVPPAHVSDMAVALDSPLWIQAVYDVEPGVARFTQAGIDQDRDQCDAQAALYSISAGDPNAILTGHDDRVTDVAFAPDGNTIATASEDGTVRLYDAATGDLKAVYSGQGQINAIAFSPNSRRLVLGYSDASVVLIEIEEDAVSGAISFATVRTFTGHSAAVNDVAYSPDGTMILSGSSDRRALLWNVADGAVLRDFQHALAINAVAFSPGDLTMVATGSEDATIKIWNITTGAQLLTLSGHTDAVNDLAFSSDGLALISASDDNTARAWSPFLGVSETTYSGHENDVVAVAISPDGSKVVTGSTDWTAHVWDSATGDTLRTVQPCSSTISSVAISPDGLQFLVGVAARNDIKLDTDPPNGNDLNITYPQGLSLRNVPSLGLRDVDPGLYYLWAQIDTDQTEVATRAYANARVNIVESFPSELPSGPGDPEPPLILALDQQVSVVTSPSQDRQIFDLGTLNEGDRIFISLLSTPGFGEFYITSDEFSLMIFDAQRKILAWYQSGFILFTADTELLVGHASSHYYVVSDGGLGVNVRVEPAEASIPEPPQQRVFVQFGGGKSVAADGQPPRTIPPLNAADFQAGWDDDETNTIKNLIMAQLESVYSQHLAVGEGSGIRFFRSDQDSPPALPFQTVYVGGLTPDGLLGVADYVDPRNATTTGTAIVYATEIANIGLGGGFANPVNTAADLGTVIGRVAAHQVGHLLGLRHTDDSNDIMQGSTIWESADPTVFRSLETALVAADEQFGVLEPIGWQDAPLLLSETVGGSD